jgi:hypothetical protein
MAVLFRGVKKGKARLTLLRMHRLPEFQNAFDAYLRGECTAVYLSDQAKKMLALASLPGWNKKRKKKRATPNNRYIYVAQTTA